MASALVFWSPGMTLESLEREVILKAFECYGRNKSMTASSLGITVKTLDNKFERYESDAENQRLLDERFRKEREYHLARARGLDVEPPAVFSEPVQVPRFFKEQVEQPVYNEKPSRKSKDQDAKSIERTKEALKRL